MISEGAAKQQPKGADDRPLVGRLQEGRVIRWVNRSGCGGAMVWAPIKRLVQRAALALWGGPATEDGADPPPTQPATLPALPELNAKRAALALRKREIGYEMRSVRESASSRSADVGTPGDLDVMGFLIGGGNGRLGSREAKRNKAKRNRERKASIRLERERSLGRLRAERDAVEAELLALDRRIAERKAEDEKAEGD